LEKERREASGFSQSFENKHDRDKKAVDRGINRSS